MASTRWRCQPWLVTLTAAMVLTGMSSAEGAESTDLERILSVSGTEGASAEAQAAWGRLASGGPGAISAMLLAMKDADSTAENWLRAAVDSACEASSRDQQLPVDELRIFLQDTSQSPRARRTAYEWIVRQDASQKSTLLASMLNDPSMSLRYDAVEQLLSDAELESDEEAQRATYQRALKAARDASQLETIKSALEKRGEVVDLPAVMGFLRDWHVIGPFDNTGLEHFDTAYPPETEFRTDANYEGKKGEVAWQVVTAQGKGGEVDFIKALGKEKEAVAYAFAVFVADKGDAEIRYQSKNATKVWLNGELIASNEAYHSGTAFDQYRAKAVLRQGQNTVLVKVCQNEQNMPWEKEWDVRLRVVDSLGTPLAEQPAATAFNGYMLDVF